MSDALSPAAKRPGGSELLKDLGLLVDGPQLWGRKVPSGKAGIFIVELQAGLAEAPIDIVAVRKWLEHVPEMTIDGEPATPPDVAKRLHDFWLPNEPILYVGRSAKGVGARVNAIYATP